MDLSSSHLSSETGVLQCNISSDDPKDVYLSMIWCGGRLGAAYYETDTNILYLLLETAEASPFEQSQRLIYELNPVTIVTSARQDEAFVDALQSAARFRKSQPDKATDECTEKGKCTCNCELIPSVDFKVESSKQKILSIALPELPDHYTDMERAIHISSIVPFSNTVTVRAAGGLLSYLNKTRVGVLLELPHIHTPISNIQTFSLKNILYMDECTYSALQIFQTVHHPSAYKVSSREGFSLFGIMNRTVTHYGQKLLKKWFYRPTIDTTVLNDRLEIISYFVDPQNDDLLRGLKENLKHVKNLTRLITKMKKSKLNVLDWFNIFQTINAFLRIADICHSINNAASSTGCPALFAEIVECSSRNLSSIVSIIRDIMDMEMSKQEKRFVVMPGVSSVIDEMKESYAGLPSLLSEVAQQELEEHKEYLTTCQIVYMRRIGYLLFTEKEAILKQSSSLNVPGMKFVAATDETVYYKTPSTERLDAEFGDILENIAYHEMEIMNQLQNVITRYSSIFVDVMHLTAELDCLISLATVSKDYNYVRPTLIENHEIHITGGRHPLHELTSSSFVPNDVHFGPEGLIKILTGPNASGKSVYLKQVGLIIFMAHIGCYVPAKSATICLLSRVYTMIRNSESICNSWSSFANDLNRMSMVTRKANSHSLVLLDEFGKGTATLDGSSLLSSCLTHLINKQEDSPMVICVTHFHNLSQKCLLPLTNKLHFQVMDSISSNPSEIVHLFQITDGMSKQSYASSVATKIGIPSEIVTRGQEVGEIMRRNAPVRQFNKISTTTYQQNCNDVASLLLECDLKNTFILKEFLCHIKKMMTENNHKVISNLSLQ